MSAIHKLLLVMVTLLSLPLMAKTVSLTMVDKNATTQTRALYSRLWEIEKSGFMFGHHDDLIYGRYWYGEDGQSDTKQVCGDYPAVYSVDFAEIMDDRSLTAESQEANALRRRCIIEARRRGEVIMACAHLNNPLTGGDSWDNSNSTVAAQILSNGSTAQTTFNTWLDRLAEFVNNLKDDDGNLIPIILRPFHEHTQTWSWWGTSCTTEAEFVALWQYTVKYLRDTKGCHQFIYIISPQSDGSNDTVDRFINFRWPGDDYVDMIGYDYYWGENPTTFTAGLVNLTTASRKKMKPCAVTETGVEAFTNSKFWTEQILAPVVAGDINVSFISMWRNKHVTSESDTHYFSVYPGHASEADFRTFYADSRTFFSSDLPDMYTMASGISVDGNTAATDASEEDGVELDDQLTDNDGTDEPSDFSGSLFSGVEDNTLEACLPSDNYYSLTEKADAYTNRTTKTMFPLWIKNRETKIEFFQTGATPSDDTRYLFPDLAVGDVIRVVVAKNGWTAQAAVLQDNAARASLVEKSDWFFIGGWPYYDISVNAAVLQKLQNNGLCLSGLNHKVLGVYVIKCSGSLSAANTATTTTISSSAITLSGWSGNNVTMPTVKSGDVLTLNVTASASAQMQSYVTVNGTKTFFIGNSTGWNGINVSEGTPKVTYIIASDSEASLINSAGSMTFGGQNMTVNSIALTSTSTVRNDLPISCSNWKGHALNLPTVSSGDVIAVSGTASSGAMLQSYIANGSSSYYLIGNSTGWNGVNVSEGSFTETYTVASDTEASLINAQGGMTIGGVGITVNSVSLNGSTVSQASGTVTRTYTAAEVISTGDFTLSASLGWKKGVWHGIVLPYDVKGETAIRTLFGLGDSSDINDLICIDSLASVSQGSDGSLTIGFGRIKNLTTVLRANTPYIIKMSASVDDGVAFPTETFGLSYGFTGITASIREAQTRLRYLSTNDNTGVRIAIGGVEREIETLTDSNDFYFSGGELYRVSASGTSISGGRAYLRIEASPLAAAKINVSFDQVTTGMEKVSRSILNDGIRYNLSGQRVGKDYKGITIYKGRKRFDRIAY